MIFLDDRLLTHPKLLKAGARLGQDGVSKAFHLYVWGIAYARQHSTDGFISSTVLASCGVVSGSGSIAKVLANRTVRLWRKVKGGYEIHDYHKYNPKASEVKEKRERDRLRKAEERSRRNGNVSTMDTAWTSRARARAPAVPIPSTNKKKRTSTDAPRRLALARSQNPKTETPTFALACVVMREALQRSWSLDHDGTLANVAEHFKTLCAQRGLAYDSELVRKAYDAVETAAFVRRRA